MKKIILIISIFFITTNVYASTVVMDKDTNRVLYGESENEKKLIASTTKIATAMVVINNADLSKKITVDERVLKSFGSGIYIEIGEEILIEDLLYGLMLRSGNDAAIVLANEVGGSEEGFAILMNELAFSLGMNNTKFINASGLENEKGEGNTSTAYDMAILMSYAMNNDIFKKITSTKKKMVKTNYKTYEWYNKNKLLNMYKYTTGGKTGYTKKAYRTLVTSASKDEKNLIIVTLDEANDFEKHKNLYEEIFSKYNRYRILNKNNYYTIDNYCINNDYYMLLTEKEYNNINISYNKIDDVKNRDGYLTIELNDKIYHKEELHGCKKKFSIFDLFR